MKHSRLPPLVMVVGMLFSGIAASSMPTASMLGNSCAGCHGPNGSSQGPATPSLAGISTEYFISAMSEYKENERPSTIMSRIAKGYSDEEIELMAPFFFAQPLLSIDQGVDIDSAAAGSLLHLLAASYNR